MLVVVNGIEATDDDVTYADAINLAALVWR